ncbi:MAG: hypothetical protein AAF677_07225, partial [Pseudomonadota bacterium]
MLALLDATENAAHPDDVARRRDALVAARTALDADTPPALRTALAETLGATLAEACRAGAEPAGAEGQARDRARGLLYAAAAHHRAEGDGPALSRALRRLAALERDVGDKAALGRAVTLAAGALTAAPRDSAERAKALLAAGLVDLARETPHRARRRLSSAMHLSRKLGDADGTARAAA